MTDRARLLVRLTDDELETLAEHQRALGATREPRRAVVFTQREIALLRAAVVYRIFCGDNRAAEGPELYEIMRKLDDR